MRMFLFEIKGWDKALLFLLLQVMLIQILFYHIEKNYVLGAQNYLRGPYLQCRQVCLKD